VEAANGFGAPTAGSRHQARLSPYDESVAGGDGVGSSFAAGGGRGWKRRQVIDLRYSDGIAAARTLLALEADASALERRLPQGWELAPYAGDDLRGTSFRGPNTLVPFHEVYAVRSQDGHPAGLRQMSYIAFVSQAREKATGELAHLHWFTYTEDPAGVPGKYGDGVLARITRTQTFSKEQRGETRVRETFSAVGQGGDVHLSLDYEQGGDLVICATPAEPNLLLRATRNPEIVRWYQEDQVMNVVRSDPLGVNRVSEISLDVNGELGDVCDGNERVVAVVIQRPYMRQVYVPWSSCQPPVAAVADSGS
jgi:hypothetical protein